MLIFICLQILFLLSSSNAIDFANPPTSSSSFTHLPIINISALIHNTTERSAIIRQIGNSCRQIGFFYISDHEIDQNLQLEVDLLAQEYFKLPDDAKREISMRFGGKAWRGSFLVGDEMTSGVPDQKEGLYFGSEKGPEETLPLHGPNLWPKGILGQRMKVSVLTYMDQLTRIGHLLIRAIFESLGVPSHILSVQFSDPTILFRLFHYPPHNESYGPTSQPVGEHTDYGYLTLLRQDSTGGLQAKLRKEVNEEIVEEWIDVPPIPNTFVVNLGDALQHNTGGLLLATPHRVKQRINTSSSRYSFPLFFDPSFTSEMVSVEKLLTESDRKKAKANQQLAKGRWDHADPAQYRGIYGDYLVSKVTKVFPRLAVEVGLGKPTDSSPGGLGERTGAGTGEEL